MTPAESSRMPMQGKVCLVTGGTSGIGAAAALGLARLGSTVVIVARDPQRCAAVAERMSREAGAGRVLWQSADLSRPGDVRRLASSFLERHPRLDVLVNNAGAVFATRRETPEGIEMTLAVNHLGPFLLTNLLLDRLRACSPARIVTVASDAHRDAAGFDFDDPHAKSGRGLAAYPRTERASLLFTIAMPWAHPAFRQYARTKVANILFTHELSRRLAGSGVTANALHPGLVSTDMPKGNGSFGWFMGNFMRLFGISPQRGADTVLYLATAPELASRSGRYFVRRREVEPAPGARDPDAAARLWRWSQDMVGLNA